VDEAPERETHVRFEGVHKLFGDFAAVEDLDLDIRDGEFLVLVGPSGCGKTTTLRMLAGLERPTYGTISIRGRVINRVRPQDRNIALVFQSYALYPHMTVRENLAFGMKARRERRASIRARIHEVAEILELSDFLDRRPASLSGGQRQRVALGRAMIRQPEVFLMDEPLSNLDAALRVQMRAELARLHERLGVTTVYVTHDQVEAMTMGDRIAIMHRGQLQQIDAPEPLYARPANLFVAGFIGSPKMNLVHAGFVSEAGEVSAECLETRIPLDDEARTIVSRPGPATVAAVVGLRPEDLRWAREAPPECRVRLRGEVELVEPLGSETLVTVLLGGQRLVARFPPRSGLRPGEQVELALDPAHMHLFDAKSGESLLAGAAPARRQSRPTSGKEEQDEHRAAGDAGHDSAQPDLAPSGSDVRGQSL
jgi:multiple sugar transport system ATP-binding protein